MSTPFDTAWAQQRVWSQTANRLKRVVDRARAVALVLASSTAVLAVAAGQAGGVHVHAGRALSAAAAITAGFATLAQRRVSTENLHNWTRARSASEGLKTEVYSYLAGGTNYTGPDRDQRLGEETRAILEHVEDLQRHTLGLTPDDKKPRAVHDTTSYIKQRVNHQICSYYQPKAASYEQRVRTFRLAGTLLGALAVVLAALASAYQIDGLAVWVPVVTTIATSLAAFVAAARYDYLVIEYLRTAQRLTHLCGEQQIDRRLPDPQFIDACENAISVENQAWMARWTDPPRQT